MTLGFCIADIPDLFLLGICRHARDSFPLEVCGWISGPRESSKLSALCKVSSRASSNTESAFRFPESDLWKFATSFDSEEPAKIVYHSHPSGPAYFSAADRRAAQGPSGRGPMYPVMHMVVGRGTALNREALDIALYGWAPEKGYRQTDFVSRAAF